jgi:hypothetical protein
LSWRQGNYLLKNTGISRQDITTGIEEQNHSLCTGYLKCQIPSPVTDIKGKEDKKLRLIFYLF